MAERMAEALGWGSVDKLDLEMEQMLDKDSGILWDSKSKSERMLATPWASR
jgi:hypothetical protein